MANANGYNPVYHGRVTAAGFEALHGKGVSSTVVALTAATPVSIFGTENPFTGIVTGVLVVAIGNTAKTITLAGTAGTIATITSPSTTGGVGGSASVLANTAIAKGGTTTVVSDGTADTSQLIIFYKVTDI